MFGTAGFSKLISNGMMGILRMIHLSWKNSLIIVLWFRQFLFLSFFFVVADIMASYRTCLVLCLILFAVLSHVHTSEDFYELLGIERDATAKDIRRAFKKLALSKHPDKNTVSQSKRVIVMFVMSLRHMSCSKLSHIIPYHNIVK